MSAAATPQIVRLSAPRIPVSRKAPGEVQGSNHSPHRARHPPSGSVCAPGAMAIRLHYSQTGLSRKETTMFRIPLTHTKSRRDLAGSLRNSRPRKHARLRHRRLQAERLEDRRLLAWRLRAEQPAARQRRRRLQRLRRQRDHGSRAARMAPATVRSRLGDVNQDGIDDFYLAAPGQRRHQPRSLPGVHHLWPRGIARRFPC